MKSKMKAAAIMLALLFALMSFTGCDLFSGGGDGDGDEDKEYVFSRTSVTAAEWTAVGRTGEPVLPAGLTMYGVLARASDKFVYTFYKGGSADKLTAIADTLYAVAGKDINGNAAAKTSLLTGNKFLGYYYVGQDLFYAYAEFFPEKYDKDDGTYYPANRIQVFFELQKAYVAPSDKKMLADVNLPSGNFKAAWSYTTTGATTLSHNVTLIRVGDDYYNTLMYTAENYVEYYFDYLAADSYKVYTRPTLSGTTGSWTAGTNKSAFSATSDFLTTMDMYVEADPAFGRISAGSENLAVLGSSINCRKFTGTSGGSTFTFWYHGTYGLVMKVTVTGGSTSIESVCTTLQTSGVTGFGSVTLPV